MKITLAIRTHNEASNIEKCLEAVLNQTLLPSEILVVDNCSTDNTVKLAKKICPSCRILKNTISGYSSGLNLAFQESTNDYLCFLSADCFPNKNWLKKLSQTMLGENAAVCQGVEIAYPKNNIHEVINYYSEKFSHPKEVKFFNNTNTLYNKFVLKKFIPFKDIVSDGSYGAEDTLLSVKYNEKGFKAFIVPEAIVRHNMFPCWNDFKKRAVAHGRAQKKLLFKFPLIPRLYLNSLYWTIIDLISFLKTGKSNFLVASFYRARGYVLGFLI